MNRIYQKEVTRKAPFSAGFSLTEVALVFLVAAAIIVAVTSGGALIENARVTKSYNDVSQFTIAIEKFYQKYKSLPGDMSDVSSLPGATPGNGNSVIDTADVDESRLFWQHLQLAGLISGSYSGGSSFVPGVDVPEGPIDNTGYTIVPNDKGEIIIRLSRFSNGADGLSVFTPEDAESLDSGADDGKPLTSTSRVRGVNGSDASGGNVCYTGSDETAVYNVGSDVASCMLDFVLNPYIEPQDSETVPCPRLGATRISDTRSCPLGYPGKIIEACRPSGWAVTDITCSAAKCSGERLYVYKDTRLESCADNHVGAVLRECSETGLWVDAVDQGDYVCTEDTSVCSVEGAGRILPCGQGYTGGIEQTCTSGNWVTGSDSCTAIACSLPTAKLGDTATATEITGTSASCSNNEIDSTVNTNYRCKKVDGTDCDSPTDGIVKACSMTGAAQGRWEIAANSCVSNSYATILPDGCDPAAAPINCPGCPNGSKGLGCPTGQTGQNNFRCITVNSNGDTAWEPLGNNTCRPLSCGDFAVGSVRQSQKFSCPDAMAGEVYEVCNICEVGEPCYTQDNANRGKALWELNFSNCAPACSGAADNAGYAHWPNADAGDSGVRSVACMEGYYGVAVRNCSSVPASGGLHAHGKWSEPSKSCFQPPFSLTGLAFWVDANNDASIQTSQGGALANDQNVATWYDMSGNGVNMSNDSDNTRPWYKPAGNGINGRPAIFFNSNDELHAPDTTKLGFERTDDFSVFVVNKDSIIKNNSALLSKMVSGGTHTGWDVGYDGSDAFKSFLINDWGASPKRGINIRVSRNVAVNEPNILGFLYDGSSNAAGMSYYFNGYKMAVAAEENNLSTSIITAARFRLGARGVDGALGNYFTGYIGEVLIYETALSDSKRRQVEEYLATKWEIPIAPKFSDIDGLTLWLDATDTDGDFDPDTNPTTISSWFDKGPYRNHVANTGGTLYRTASGINGKQSISFNGASNNMNFAISPFDTGNVGYTAIVALQVNSLTNSYSNSNSIFFTGGSGNNTRAFFRVAASGAFVHGWGDGSGNGNSTYDLFTTAGTAKANTPYIFTSIYEPSEATKVGRRIYVNGVESAYSPSTALNMATGAGQIGRGNGGQNLRGFLGELMTYNRALNDDEREAVEQYLSAKWGIAIPWTPKDMTGLTAWWDGDNIGSLYKSGNITTWKDKSGNGNDNWRNTATATAHPFPSKIGSRGAIGFDGADQFNHQSGAAPLGNNAHSFFVVAQPTVQATDGPLAHFYCGTNCNASQLSISTAGLLQITDSTNSLRLVSSTNFANRVMLVSVIADGAETSVYVDGSKKLALDVTLPTTTTTDFAVGGAYIGGNYRYYNGKVGEILVFNRAVSDTERQTVEAYLGAKWPIGETWAPTRIPGLQLWLDADDSSSVVIQSDVVTQWNNKATELAALTHVTGNAGVTWVQNAKNGRAVMNFNGSSYFVSNTTMVPKTLTMVHKTPNGGCNGNSCWLMEFLGVSNTHIKAYGDKEEFYGAFLTYPHYVNGQIQRLGGRPPRVFNNTYQVTTFVMDNPSSSSGTFYLKTNASLNNIAPGQVAEVLVWNRNITTAERLQVEAYLSEKWGVPVSRPNTNSPAYGLQGLALWLDAADTVTIATPRNDGQSTDNDDVGPPAWANKGNIVYNSAISGLNNNGAFSAVQQEVANQPTYQQAGLGIDRPSFRFDGVNDSINVPNFSMYPVMTAFVVGDFAASPAASTMMIEHGAIISGGATDGFFMWGGSNAFYQRRSSTNYVISGQPNGWHGSSTTVITAYNDASTLGYYVNDSLPTGQTAIATASSGGNGLTTATLTIGNHSVDTTFKTIGDIGEILIYDRYLPATERKIVEDYLVNKWVNGITADSVVNGVGATQGITSWFDAADTTHMTVDGSNKISQVNDIKTATPKYNSLQSNASARPTYVPNVQNGNGVMRFDGVDDVLTLENDDTSDALTLAEVIGSAAATEDSDFTVMSVLSLANATENDAFPTSNQMVFGVASATGNVGLAARANSTRLVGFSISDGQVYQSTKEVSLGTFYVTALYQGAGSLYFDVNGVNISKQPAEAIRSDLDAAAFMVGGGNTNKPFKGDIGEFITFSKMLPQNAREQIESYLGGKWGIPITTGADGASSFTDPTSVNGLTLWLDADDASTINGGGTLAEGTSVTTWSDKSDNNFDFCSGGSCSTTAVTYTPNIVNGKPAIKFTGTSQTLRSAESIKTLRFTNNNQGSVFIVSRVDSLGRINFAWQNANGNTDRYLISFPHSSNNIFYDFGYCCTENVGRLTKVAPSSIVDNWTVMSAIRSPDNKGMVYSNGELLVLGTMTQDLDVDESSYFYFGKNSVDSNAQDYYAEMLLYNVAISDTDRENIENYLMTKWGIGSGAGNDAAYLNDPSDLNGLTVWLDAADSSTLNSGLPTNGGEIT